MAGQAVFMALRAAECVSTGSIGGFAYFAAITLDGELLTAQTQRGGTTTLFTEGELSGAEPPNSIANARHAAVISSGPDRPEPLSQFIASDPNVGMVTGHRLPNTFGRDGKMVNEAVLDLMRKGGNAKDALDAVLNGEPDIDAGMIALGPDRGIAAFNSRLVASRPDVGGATMMIGETGVAVLHNAIRPKRSLADMVAEIALDIMLPEPPPLGEIVVKAGTPLVHSDTHTVVVDGGNEALRIETDVEAFLVGTHNCAAIYLGAKVVRGGEVLGFTLVEPNVIVTDGKVTRLSGQESFRIPFGRRKEESGHG